MYGKYYRVHICITDIGILCARYEFTRNFGELRRILADSRHKVFIRND